MVLGNRHFQADLSLYQTASIVHYVDAWRLASHPHLRLCSSHASALGPIYTVAVWEFFAGRAGVRRHWNGLLLQGNPAITGKCCNDVPILTTIYAAIILHERLAWTQAVGLAVLIFGVMVAMKMVGSPARTRNEATER